MDNKLIKYLQETDLFSPPSADDVQARKILRAQRLATVLAELKPKFDAVATKARVLNSKFAEACKRNYGCSINNSSKFIPPITWYQDILGTIHRYPGFKNTQLQKCLDNEDYLVVDTAKGIEFGIFIDCRELFSLPYPEKHIRSLYKDSDAYEERGELSEEQILEQLERFNSGTANVAVYTLPKGLYHWTWSYAPLTHRVRPDRNEQFKDLIPELYNGQ